MASRRELGLLLSQGKRSSPAKRQDASASVPKPVLKVKPLQEVPPAKKQRTGIPVVDLTPSAKEKGKRVVTEDERPAVAAAPPSGSYASSTFSGASPPIHVPGEIDARLLDDSKAAYLKQFPARSLFKQLKGMAAFSATVLKYFESGGAWEEAMDAEKVRLTGLAERKVREMQEAADRETELARKGKEEAEKRAEEAKQALEKKEQELTTLAEQLAAAREEARAATCGATKATEELGAKTKALAAMEATLTVETSEKNKYIDMVKEAALQSWENAQEQLRLGHPGMDFSWMLVDGFVEEGALLHFDEEGRLVKAPFPGSA